MTDASLPEPMARARSRVESALSWARETGAKDQLVFALEYEGFSDWAHVVSCARNLHPTAIELLARRAEAGL